jgi:hypothetical protein
MDQMAKKLFVQLGDDFPGVRANACDALYQHLQKTGETYSGYIAEIDNAEASAQKNAELQKRYDDAIQKYGELEQLYRKAAADNAQWAQQHQSVTQPVSAYSNTPKMQHPLRAIGLVALVLLGGTGAYFWHSATLPAPTPVAVPFPMPPSMSVPRDFERDMRELMRDMAQQLGGMNCPKHSPLCERR